MSFQLSLRASGNGAPIDLKTFLHLLTQAKQVLDLIRFVFLRTEARSCLFFSHIASEPSESDAGVLGGISVLKGVFYLILVRQLPEVKELEGLTSRNPCLERSSVASSLRNPQRQVARGWCDSGNFSLDRISVAFSLRTP